MNITNPEIESYITGLCSHLRPELEALERETYQKVLLPNMISGNMQGRFLYQLTAALNPQNCLELGTFTGYSAICIALGLRDKALLTTLDVNEEIAHIPRKYFEKLNLQDKIDFRIVSAIDYCPMMDDNSLDLVFIDADKKNYPLYFEILKPKLRSGGFLLVDNVLWHGKVIKPNPNKDTLAIMKLNQMVFSDIDFETSIVPIRDGILMARKK